MKFSHSTLLAILATSAMVQAAPATVVSAGNSLVVRQEGISEALSILGELKSINQKREYVDDEEQLAALYARDDSLLSDLVSALANSGIFSEIWDTLTNDTELRTEIGNLVRSAIRGLIVQAPSLIRAVWDSGLLQDLVRTIFNDSDLRSVLFRVARSLFSSGVQLVEWFLNNRRGRSSTTAAATTTTQAAAATTTATAVYKREALDEGELLDKRDVASVVSNVVDLIKSSGIVSRLVNKVLADPERSIQLLTSVLRSGLVVVEDIYNWAKNNGLLEKGLDYIEQHGGQYGAIIGSVVGDAIDSGNATTSDVDNSGSRASGTARVSTTTSTAASGRSGSGLFAALGDLVDGGSGTTTATTAATTRTAATAAAATSDAFDLGDLTVDTTATATATAAAATGQSFLTDDSSLNAAASRAAAALNTAGAGTTLRRVRRMY